LSKSKTVNIDKSIRNNTELNVSPSYVYELIGRVDDFIDELVPESEKIAKAEGMKTLQEKHLIRVFDFRLGNKTMMLACSSCGGMFVVTDKSKVDDLSCPFCGKKRYLIKD